MWIASAVTVLLLWLIPEPLAAWGPGTHIALGTSLLSSLHLLPPATRILLEKYPNAFLYGSVAADISFAKKYAPIGRHCHHWHIGEEIHDAADEEMLRAVGIGYLSHLAADTVAHNLYVPRQLLFSATTSGIGHAYWEHRMDLHVGEPFIKKARSAVLDHDHSRADEMFDRVLSSTLFSFNTNRRLFRGMMHLQADDRWMGVFDKMLQRSRVDVDDDVVDRYLALSFDAVVDYLNDRGDSDPAAADPIGDARLQLAKELRMDTLSARARRDHGSLIETADRYFPLPQGEARWWESRGTAGEPIQASLARLSDPRP